MAKKSVLLRKCHSFVELSGPMRLIANYICLLLCRIFVVYFPIEIVVTDANEAYNMKLHRDLKR